MGQSQVSADSEILVNNVIPFPQLIEQLGVRHLLPSVKGRCTFMPAENLVICENSDSGSRKNESTMNGTYTGHCDTRRCPMVFKHIFQA